ncbi:Putative polyketide cyclase (plasmid) [Streptomyces xanthophaeus]|uniref:aromatase/cyclase n=1 Tax=Streptomyces xanthophaeus TaxID=67385 RepID=UPI00233E6427|nr:aromatase/cyclase [Streptomyces xanthophaeus]WCD91408.1 Putative polyketide cyclase [Streptomyces xanthophaeus]
MSAEHAAKATQKIRVAAPAGVVYGLIADAVKWPLYFSPTAHVEQLEFDGERERLRMWSLMDGRLKSWISWRHLDPVERRVEFRQELPASPLNSVGGTVTVRPFGPQDTELELLYDFSLDGDLPADVEWSERATDGVSRTNLTDLKGFAERWTRLDDLVLSFEESVRINGPAELVYDFLYRAGDWPGLVPHVARVDLTEEAPGVQRMTMEAVTEHGSHTTESVRICFPHAGRIIYKHTTTAPLLEAHTGEWCVAPDETGVTVFAQHNVVLREEDIAAVLGEHVGLAQARWHVREALSRHSLALLEQARKHAESAVRMLG